MRFGSRAASSHPSTRRDRPGRDFSTGKEIYRLSLLAVGVGVIGAASALALMRLIGLVTNLAMYGRLSTSFVGADGNHRGLWIIVIPVGGALAVGMIARYGSEKVRGHGIPEALEAMLVNGSRVQPRVAFWKPVSAAIAIGTGGPFGAEGPIIMTGGSLGSLLAQTFHLSAVERRILLVAGAAAGMSATFGAPIAAVLFAVELLISEFKPRSLVPIACASAVAAMIRLQVMGPAPIFAMPGLVSVPPGLMAAALGIGIAGCLLAVVLTWLIYATEDAFRRLPIHWMWWPAIGAVVVGVGGFFVPRALGVGYDSIGDILNGRLAVGVLLYLLLVKATIWIVSLGSGTSGGILAPILIIGGSAGACAAQLLGQPHPGVWALLAMSAIFAGVTRTPFTSVIFPLEVTHNVGALLPLMVASIAATGMSAFVLPRSILTERIARRGLHMTREFGADPLEMHLAGSIAHTPPVVCRQTVSPAEALADALDAVDHDWIGVTDRSGDLVAAADIGTLVRLVHAGQLGSLEPLAADAGWIGPTASARSALHQMLDGNQSYILVRASSGEALGIVTVAELVHLRREELRLERDRSRHLVLGKRARPVSAARDEAWMDG